VADSPETEAIIKKEPDVPAPDPIASRSTSGVLLICALLMSIVLAWSLYDEIYGQRPWKKMQQEFVTRENRLLTRLRKTASVSEQEIKASAEYQQLDSEAKAAGEKIEPRKKDIDKRVGVIDAQLASVTDDYQNVRGEITVDNYRIETAHGKAKQDKIRQEIAQKKQRAHAIYWPANEDPKKITKSSMNYPQMEAKYNELKAEKTKLTTERGELLKESGELEKKRDEYVKNNVIGLTVEQIASLRKRNNAFDFKMRQINVDGDVLVDRCETCHLGVREPFTITPADMRPVRNKKFQRPDQLSRAFVSHPNKDLLEIHNPDRFGCSSCHGGNGRATTNVTKGHGRHKFWLHPLYEKENTEAGCQQCHSSDRVLQGANVLNLGKDLFQYRGCVGCHRSEGFDRETDALANARQSISQLEEQIAINEREAKQSNERIGQATEEEAQKLLARAEVLRVTNSQLAARISQLQTETKYLMYDQKKVGPNLKDVQLKLRKEWIPEWLKDPENFRPGTKMPAFWRLDGTGNRTDPDNERESNERKAIAAFLWQEGFSGKLPEMKAGDASNGKELFETRGCMACHSIGDAGSEVGGDFAANLQRVGEKANFDYIVRWIYDPRERWAPYCPKEKRDLTRKDYEDKGLQFVFDDEHSTCPNDGAELQIQNMTVMPNFRLSESDARDIATYLFGLSQRQSYPDASYMDDTNLKEQGRALVKQYGCAGCHEIRGFEEEQRIGKELTAEGATPIERLDFALLTHDAELGKDPFADPSAAAGKPWYNHRGFFTNKIKDPAIFDKGKEKEPKDLLRMPKPSLKNKPEWNVALTTFLLGSKGPEGANVPQSFFYNPDTRQKDIQEGWWVIKKYNCMGCHNVQVGQKSVLSGLPRYQDPDWKDQLPPQLTSEGARVDPDWLLRFLRDPSMSAAQPKADAAATNTTQSKSTATSTTTQVPKDQVTASQIERHLRPQPGSDQNGVRTYLKARMPTFSFSPNELQALVRFFMAVSSQSDIYIKERQEPLTEEERMLARQLFTSKGAPCLKCHLTGEPEHDKTATAPNFLLASARLKPSWTFRWLLDPSQISPGTAMPSGLFKLDGERWVFSGETPASFDDYHGDHADLLVRYMFELTPDEQRRLMSTSPVETTATTPAATASTPGASSGTTKVSRNRSRQNSRRRVAAAHARAQNKKARAPSLGVTEGRRGMELMRE
jgi:cytochrome c551/c552